MSESIENQICKEILEIMKTYHKQDADGYVDSPGGLEHVGDVWKLFGKWERDLNQSNSTGLEGVGGQPLIVDDTGYFEEHCDICGDYHETDSVPMICATGDGE